MDKILLHYGQPKKVVMGTIEEIVKAIDDKLIECGKGYLTLGQANNVLVEKEIMTITEKSNQNLKKLLEKSKITHASQTSSKPRQWRIPISEAGKKRKKTIKKKTIPKYTSYQSQSKIANYTICPGCGHNLFIPNEIKNENYIECLNCRKNFRNPLRNNQNSHNTDNFEIKTLRNWVIGIVVIVIIIIIIGNLSNNGSTSSSPTLYYVNTTTYAATSKSSFDEMFRYINDRNEQALTFLIHNGQIKTLPIGSEIYLVSSHFSYCTVRLKGSSQNLLVVTEHITKK